MKIEEKCWDAGMGESLFWYRGHSDDTWELQPTVLRSTREEDYANTVNQMESFRSPNKWDDVLKHERIINQRFRHGAYSYFGDIPAIRVYFAAQHHGLPTRLLDWSLSPLVALYFACRSERDIKKNGCVYRLFPRKLPKVYDGQSNNPPSPFDDIVSKHRPHIAEFIESCLFDSQPFNACAGYKQLKGIPVIPIIPTIITSRITAQASRFTFHLPVTQSGKAGIKPPLDFHKIFQGEPHSFAQYIVPANAKTKILVELNRLGIHDYSLFPDIDNLALHLKTIYCSRLVYQPLKSP